VDRNLLLKIFANPQVQFKIAPQNTYGLAQFLHRVSAIRNLPDNWRDYFLKTLPSRKGADMHAPAFHLVRPPLTVEPLLSVKHVSLEYRTEQRTVRATHDVSFDVFGATVSCCWGHRAAASRPC
jgi:hypothetical protein